MRERTAAPKRARARPLTARGGMPQVLLALSAATLACSATSALFPPPTPTLPAPLQWRVTLGKDKTLVSPPALADGLLVYLENAQDVVARDAGSGAEKWRHTLQKSNVVLRPLAIAGELVFVEESAVDGAGADYAHVLALDLRSGQVSWDQKFTSGPAMGYFDHPVTDGNRVYVAGRAAPNRWVLDAAEPATGVLRWQLPLTGTAPSGDPLIDNGLVFIATDNPTASAAPYADDLLALDAASGALRWKVALDARTAPILAAGNGRVYAAADNGTFWALDETTGKVVWQFHFGNGSQLNFSASPPALAGDTLYFGDSDQYIYALNVADGSQRWRVQLNALMPRRPAISGGRLYLGLTNGLLTALDAANGGTLWTTLNPFRQSWPTGYTPPLDTEPVVVNGALVYFNGAELVSLTVP